MRLCRDVAKERLGDLYPRSTRGSWACSRSAGSERDNGHRLAPVSTKPISRPSQGEQISRLCQSRTEVHHSASSSGSYPSAFAASSSKIDCEQE